MKNQIINTQAAALDLAFERFIAAADVHEASRRTYRRQLKQFAEWLKATGRAEKLYNGTATRADIIAYKEHLLTERHLSPLTAGGYLVVVRLFFEYAEGEKLYPNIARGIKAPHRRQQFVKQHLTDEQAADLLDQARAYSQRDFALLNLLLRTGLRTIEAARANVEDITYKGGRPVLMVHGKGRDAADQFVILTAKALRPLKDYLAARNAKPGEPLFVSHGPRHTGGRLSTRTISFIAKQTLRAIGIDAREYSAHSLRHTTATAILKHGGTLADAQGVLRHSNPATTQIYLKSIEEEQRIARAAESIIDQAF